MVVLLRHWLLFSGLRMTFLRVSVEIRDGLEKLVLCAIFGFASLCSILAFA